MSRAAHGNDAAHAAEAAEVTRRTRLPREERSGDSPADQARGMTPPPAVEPSTGSHSSQHGGPTPSHGGSSVAASSRNYPGAAKSASGDLHARHGKTMTPEQRQERIAFIKDHRERGYRWNQIAALLDMRSNALEHWWKWNTQTKFDPRPPTQERKCLCCGDRFESEGAHNRLCGDCRARSHVLSPMAPDPGGDRGRRVMPMRGPRK